MKRLTLITSLILCLSLGAQNTEEKYKGNADSLNSTIESLYNVISGEKGEMRDWDLLKYLLHPKAKFVATGKNKEGIYKARYLTVEDYIASSGKWLVENGFFEDEIHREVQTFGNITQVFSTYQCFNSKKDTKPFMRGINSIQLMYDNQRWWVMNIYFTQETPENPIPSKYLPAN